MKFSNKQTFLIFTFCAFTGAPLPLRTRWDKCIMAVLFDDIEDALFLGMDHAVHA
jgi:hypothetical protein